jgi:hypothetical protein
MVCSARATSRPSGERLPWAGCQVLEPATKSFDEQAPERYAASANLPAKVRYFPPGGVVARANVDTIRERRHPCKTEG